MIHPSFREVQWTTGSADVFFLGPGHILTSDGWRPVSAGRATVPMISFEGDRPWVGSRQSPDGLTEAACEDAFRAFLLKSIPDGSTRTLIVRQPFTEHYDATWAWRGWSARFGAVVGVFAYPEIDP